MIMKPQEMDLSALEKEAISKAKKGAPRNWIAGVSAVIIFFGIWETVTRLGFVDSMFLCSVSAIIVEAFRIFFVTGEIYHHLYVSFVEFAAGLTIAIAIGIPLGLGMGRYPGFRAVMEPFVTALYSTPRVALIPLLILWLGIGLTAKIFFVFLGAVFPIIINAQTGVENADPALVEAATSMRATERQIFLKIMLPAALPLIIAGLRLAVGVALIMVVVGEMYASTAGVGFFIMRAGATYDTPKAFVGILIFTVTGLTLTRFIRYLENRIAPWRSTGGNH
jgi:ABC-type nitrate/sulfonate/bicarbonate transport system permease component